MTLEDETGAANIIVWPDQFLRFRKEVLTGRLLMVSGKLQREGLVIHLIADRVEDCSHLLARLTQGDVDFGDAGMARADEVRSGVSIASRDASAVREAMQNARAAKILPPSRDFH
jgi:error-prone DNA polymerase